MEIEKPNNTDPRPKRRRTKGNPYNIFTVGIESNESHYYVSFIDTQGIPICMEISKDIYETLDKLRILFYNSCCIDFSCFYQCLVC